MINKKNVSITIDNKLFRTIDENFDNKSKLTEWIIIKILSRDEKYNKILKK